MQPITNKMRVLLFLYSTQNLVGSVLAIIGLVMFFAGWINDWWFPIVVGLYAVGLFAVPKDEMLEIRVRNESSQADLTDS